MLLDKFFDSDFYFNWTDNGEEYLKVFHESTILPLIKIIKENLDTLFEFRTTSYSTREVLLLRKDVKLRRCGLIIGFKQMISVTKRLLLL